MECVTVTRRKEREQAFFLVFALGFQDEIPAELAQTVAECQGEEIAPFALQLAEIVKTHQEKIDGFINKFSTTWKIERLSRVVAALLRLAIGEILFVENVPLSVSINEAVELAKQYGGDEDPAYLNGVLGSFAKEVGEKESPHPKQEEEA